MGRQTMNSHRERPWLYCCAALATTLLAGCPGRENVPCTENADCNLSGGGVCTEASIGNRWCAYPDPDCPTGLRYSDKSVGDDLGGVCVEGAAYTVTVRNGGNGSGVVSSDPPGLMCTSGTCTGKFLEGTVVKLSATVITGSFLGWSDACRGRDECSIIVDRNLTVGAVFGVPGEALWARQLGSIDTELGHSITVDGDGNVIAVGEFNRNIAPGMGVELQSNGFTDVYVVKLASATGDLIWAKRFGGPGNDRGFGAAVDESNNVYVVGEFAGVVDFGGGALQAQGLADMFVLKLQPNGDFGWARRIGGTGYESAKSVAARGGAVVIAGAFAGEMRVDASTFNAVNDDIFILSLTTTTGTTNWAKTFGGAYTDAAKGVAIDSDRNLVITGSFTQSVNFGGGVLSAGGELDNIFLLKLAGANGAHLLSRAFGVATVHDVGAGVAVDSANSIFITGYFGAIINFGCANSLTASQVNNSDIFLVKFSQAGACVWARGFGGSGATGVFDRRGFGVTVDASDDVAIAGSFCGLISFGGPMLTSASDCGTGTGSDVFAARFTGDGTHLNSIRAGGTSYDEARGVAESSDGRFFVTGHFNGFGEFGGNAFQSAGGSDAFMVGLAPL
jgi:hypothetical protein